MLETSIGKRSEQTSLAYRKMVGVETRDFAFIIKDNQIVEKGPGPQECVNWSHFIAMKDNWENSDFEGYPLLMMDI